MKLLELENVFAGYEKIQVLNGISFSVKRGEIVSLIGPNGAGKSTVLKTIFGLTDLYNGKIVFEKKQISSKKPFEIIGEGIVFIPQGKSVFPSLTVKENLEISLLTKKEKNFEIVEKLFPEIIEKKKQIAITLSGGQQQMLALARAIMLSPKLLLLDEPSLGLSPKLKKEVFEKIKEINELGTTILLVEQNIDLALKYSNKTIALKNGKIVFEKKSDMVSVSKELKEIYLD